MVVDSWYNGYSPKERDDKYKELKKLIANGVLAVATTFNMVIPSTSGLVNNHIGSSVNSFI